MISEPPPLKNRVASAAIAVGVNFILWIVVPSFISNALGGVVPSLLLSQLSFVLAFGATIIGLVFLGEITKGMAISVPFISGAFVAEAFYVWLALGGGVFSFSAAGLHVSFEMRTLVFVFVLPLLFNAVRVPVEYLLDQNEAGGPAKESPATLP